MYESVPGFWARFDDMRTTTIRFLKQAILALARHGEMVIVGRGAFAVLVDFADVLNVRVQAPFPIRVRRAMEKEKITESRYGNWLPRTESLPYYAKVVFWTWFPGSKH